MMLLEVAGKLEVQRLESSEGSFTHIQNIHLPLGASDPMHVASWASLQDGGCLD